MMVEFLFFFMVACLFLMGMVAIATVMYVRPRLGKVLFGVLLAGGFMAGAAIPAVPFF